MPAVSRCAARSYDPLEGSASLYMQLPLTATTTRLERLMPGPAAVGSAIGPLEGSASLYVQLPLHAVRPPPHVWSEWCLARQLSAPPLWVLFVNFLFVARIGGPR